MIKYIKGNVIQFAFLEKLIDKLTEAKDSAERAMDKAEQAEQDASEAHTQAIEAFHAINTAIEWTEELHNE